MDMPRHLDASFRNLGIGQPVPRGEDPILVTGRGAYTDDVSLPGQAYAAFNRSTMANGRIRGIDVTAALAMPGVLAVYTADDMAGYGRMKCMLMSPNRDGTPFYHPDRGALAKGRVSFVGDPIAFVVAETRAEAIDAAEAIAVDIEPLAAATDARRAVEPGAPLVYDDVKVPQNVGLDFHFGKAEEVAKAFASAAHITRLRLINSRIVMNPMEPRSVMAEVDKGSGRVTLYSPSQGVTWLRAQAADFLNMPQEMLRIVSRNVGGSFGMKACVFPETFAVIHAARELGRPVKWTSTRSEAFLADYHGRDHDVDAELALDQDGHFLAVRLSVYGNLGAFLTLAGPAMPTAGTARNLPGVYRTPVLEVNAKAAYTHTAPIAAYRGAGRPEANYYMERLVDAAAAEMGIDRIELRRRNHIQPDQFPFNSASGMVYDSGNFPAVLDRALEVSDWAGFPRRREESAARGKLRGIGLGQFLEMTAPAAPELAHVEFGADGTVTLYTGTHDQGQGHWSTFGQVLFGKLGLPFQNFRLVQSDSDKISHGAGTGGSKSAMSGSTAASEAADIIIERGRKVAAHMLEAGVADVEFGSGRFTIAGTDRGIGLMEVVQRLRAGERMPDGVPATLDVSHLGTALQPTFPNGAHVAEVEIDPDTGVVELLRYSSVNDFGTLVNPLLAEGQIHGGVVQGIGQCVLEETRYGEDGQLITGSFMDYAMPRAENVPMVGFESLPSPATTNALGIKGCGEAGCAGGLTSMMNAVVDALSVLGIRHIDMPATPRRVWEAIQAAKAGKAA